MRAWVSKYPTCPTWHKIQANPLMATPSSITQKLYSSELSIERETHGRRVKRSDLAVVLFIDRIRGLKSDRKGCVTVNKTNAKIFKNQNSL